MRQPYQNDLETRDGASLQLDRIVVGIDFTEPSLAVARWVGRNLARTAELTLVHVTPMRPIPNVSRIRSNPLVAPDSRSGDRLRSLHGALRGLASMIGGTRAAVEVRVGDPATQLAAYANLVDADLVVVGGSTAYHVAPRHETATTERLLRRISRPVLIARSVHAAPTTVLAAVADDVGTYRPCSPPRECWRGRVPRVSRRFRSHAGGQLHAEIIAVGTHTPAGEITRGDSDTAALRLVRTGSYWGLVVPDFARAPVPPLDIKRYKEYPSYT